VSSVDVVVPCYNYARFLPTCVNSILAERNLEIRVLIIDDASTDDTAGVGKALAAQDARVTLHRHTQNQGLISTANEGVLGWAAAKYTLLIAADDALTRGALARAARVMDRRSDIGMTYGLALVVGHDTEIGFHDYPIDRFEHRVVAGPAFLHRVCQHWQGVPTPTAVVRTELQRRIGGYHPDFPHTSDAEMWMRIATQASIAAIRTPQGYYRRHAGNMSSAYMNRPLSDLREQIGTALEVRKTWGGQLPQFDSWINIMRRRLAAQACWMAGLALERGDAPGARACLDFAVENSAALWRTRPWWRLQTKRLLGRRFVQHLRKRSGGPQNPSAYDPFKVGEIIGWWPDGRSPE